MPNIRRPWSEYDIAKLRALAGKRPVAEIATKLRRSPTAVYIEASRLGLSFRTQSGPRSDAKGFDMSRTEGSHQG